MVIFLWILWFFYLLAFIANWLRVRLERRRPPSRPPRPRSRQSDAGLAMQLAGLIVVFAFRRAWDEPDWLALCGLACAGAGTLLTWAALAHLGRHWQVRAAPGEADELVMSGPYRVVRHPAYTGLFLMALGTILLITNWTAAVGAVILIFTGTEMRIAAEDRLLSEQFSDSHASYRRRTAVWLPPFR